MLDFHLNSLTFNYFSQYQLPRFLLADNFQSQILKRGGDQKNECLGGLKEFLQWLFAWGAMFFGFASSISNVDLGLF